MADQAYKSFDYGDLQQVIQISIMDYTLFEDHKRFFAKYEIKDEEGYRYTDKLKFYVMDLTAIAQATEAEKEQGLVEWAEAFKADNWQEVNNIDNSAIKEAAKTMEMILKEPTERELIRARMDALNDQYTLERAAERRGSIGALAKLVKKGRISIAEAAEEANLSVKDFAEKAGIQFAN